MKSISLYCILDFALAWSLSHPWSDSTTIQQYMEHTSTSSTTAQCSGWWLLVQCLEYDMSFAFSPGPELASGNNFYNHLPPPSSCV